jgi:hypothetical protein
MPNSPLTSCQFSSARKLSFLQVMYRAHISSRNAIIIRTANLSEKLTPAFFQSFALYVMNYLVNVARLFIYCRCYRSQRAVTKPIVVRAGNQSPAMHILLHLIEARLLCLLQLHFFGRSSVAF